MIKLIALAALAAVLSTAAGAEEGTDWIFGRAAETGQRIAGRHRVARVIVEMGNRRLTAYRADGSVCASYPVALGRPGSRTFIGSSFTLRRHPNTRFTAAWIFSGLYEIHGPPDDGQSYSNNSDWTRGCFALSREDVLHLAGSCNPQGATLSVRP